MMRRDVLKHAALAGGALAVGAPAWAEDAPIRRPVGIYAVVVVKKQREGSDDPGRFQRVLRNPAVSGVAVRAYWEDLEPEEHRYDFAVIDAALRAAQEQRKTVQLVLVPGFYSPPWLLRRLPSLDEFLSGAKKPAGLLTGGKATFAVAYGPDRNESRELPLPWDPAYTAAWQDFLRALNQHCGNHPGLVSIAVAGPTSMSAEMSLPNDTREELATWEKILELSFPPGPYRASNKAVTEAWRNTVDFYGKTFRNMTIVVTRGAGLLRFSSGEPREAKDEILEYFAGADLGRNLKATQTSGMNARRDSEGGIEGAKELALQSAGKPLPILAGGQFNSSATAHPAKVGRPRGAGDNAEVGPAAAVRNVLKNFFNHTPYGGDFGATPGKAPVHYLQVYETDILYADTHEDVQAVFNDVKTKLDALNAAGPR